MDTLRKMAVSCLHRHVITPYERLSPCKVSILRDILVVVKGDSIKLQFTYPHMHDSIYTIHTTDCNFLPARLDSTMKESLNSKEPEEFELTFSSVNMNF